MLTLRDRQGPSEPRSRPRMRAPSRANHIFPTCTGESGDDSDMPAEDGGAALRCVPMTAALFVEPTAWFGSELNCIFAIVGELMKRRDEGQRASRNSEHAFLLLLQYPRDSDMQERTSCCADLHACESPHAQIT